MKIVFHIDFDFKINVFKHKKGQLKIGNKFHRLYRVVTKIRRVVLV